MLNLDFSNYKGATWLKDWWRIVKGHFEQVQTAVNANETAIGNEATARQNADTALSGRLDMIEPTVDDLTDLYDVVDNHTYLANDIDSPPAPDVGVLFKFYNNTSSTVRMGFAVQIDDETFVYKFSEPIYARETRLCVVTETPKPDYGEIYVLSDKELRSLVNAAQTAADSANAGITTETANRIAADTALARRIDDVSLDKILTFTSRTLPAPYIPDPQEEDSTIDINLSGMFTINGRSCGTMNTATVSTSFAPNKKYIIASFNINTEAITVTSSDSYVETNITNDIWTFTLADYVVSVVYNDDDVDDPNYGDYVIRHSEYDWDISVSSEGAAEYGHIEAEYNMVGELSNLTTTNKSSLVAAINEVNGKVPPVHYVQCDGDHDELKIQAALDELRDIGNGGYVYVLGEEITLTNDTPNSLTTPSGYTSVLSVPMGVILDFCGGLVTFKNTTPAQKQYAFYLGSRATLRNALFEFDDTTVTSSSINPALIYANNACVINGCTFEGGYPLNYAADYDHYIIRLGENNIWSKSTITNWRYTPIKTFYGSNNKWVFFYAGKGSYVDKSTFKSITEDVTSLDTQLLEYDFIKTGDAVNIDHCMFDTVTAQYGRINLGNRTNQTYCRFISCDGLAINGGNTSLVIGNRFRTCTARKMGNGWITVQANMQLKDNVFTSLKLANGSTIYSESANAEISRNTFTSVNATGISGEADLIEVTETAYITDNKFKFSNTSVIPIFVYGDGTLYITGNITVGAKLISDASDTSSSVIANNIVGGVFVPTGAA